MKSFTSSVLKFSFQTLYFAINLYFHEVNLTNSLISKKQTNIQKYIVALFSKNYVLTYVEPSKTFALNKINYYSQKMHRLYEFKKCMPIP